jgi:hypothetical protein
MDYDVRALLRSVYLQGVEDATRLIVERPESVGLMEK